jgi:hypothetical protein
MNYKFSPTVSKAYKKDFTWFDRYSNGQFYDPEGYDKYGYNAEDKDRAGYKKTDYNVGRDKNNQTFIIKNGFNFLYEKIEKEFEFDDTQPYSPKQDAKELFNKAMKLGDEKYEKQLKIEEENKLSEKRKKEIFKTYKTKDDDMEIVF